MITEAIMQFLFDLFNEASGWMQDHLPAAPTFWADAADALTTLNSHTSATVQWFLPIGPAMGIGVSIMALVVALGLVKLVRRAISLFTGGGGSG